MNTARSPNTCISSGISQGRLAAVTHNPQMLVPWHSCLFLANVESNWVFLASKHPSKWSYQDPVVWFCLCSIWLASSAAPTYPFRSPPFPCIPVRLPVAKITPVSFSRGFLWPPEPVLHTYAEVPEVPPKLIRIPQTMTCEG